MRLVAQLPGPGGTDLELFSRRLSAYRPGADSPVVAVDPPVERHFALVGNEQSGATIVDVTQPEQPFVAAKIERCTIGQGDPQVTPDGMVAALTKQMFGSCATVTGKVLRDGSAIIDLADVYNPKVVGLAEPGFGSHTHTIHPSGKYLYISNSGGFDDQVNALVPIYDITDPANPRLVQVWRTPGDSPHDIRFSADGTRAYMVGVHQSRVVNTENPENPVLVSTIVPPGSTIGHDAVISPDKRFLFLGDEAAGGNPFPCPGGGIYAYDLRDERNPELLGVAYAGGGPVTTRNQDESAASGEPLSNGCTAHVMDLNPDGKSMTVGWYGLGTRTFSFAGLYDANGAPKPGTVAAWGRHGTGLVETGFLIPPGTSQWIGASTWAAKQYHKVPGYIFSNDRALGFYVTKITE